MDTKDVEQLSAYLDDELTADERLQFEQRLQTDRQLQAELEELRQTVALIRQMPLLKAPRNYTLNPAAFQQRKRPFIYQIRPVLAIAAALVMVFGAVFFFLSLQQGSDTDSQTGEIAVAPTTRLEKSSPQPTFMAQSTEVAFAAPTATPLPTMLPPQVADEMNREADDEAEAESGVLLEEAESVGEAAASEFIPPTTPPMPAPGAVEPTVDPLSIPSGGGGVVQETPLETYDYAAESAALAPQQGQFSSLMQQIEFFIQQFIHFLKQLL